MKKVLAFFLAIFTILSCCTSVFAISNTDEETEQRNSIYLSANADLVFVGGEGCARGTVYGPLNTVEIISNMSLYRKRPLGLGWTKLADYETVTTNNSTMQVRENYFTPERGKTYKIIYTFTVYIGLAGEMGTREAQLTYN